jgi:lysophospholipase L1-like esterase
MTRRHLTTPLVLASLVALLVLAAVAPAGAKPATVASPAKVAVGHPVVGTSANGLASILVPVHYPIELKGRLAELRVALIGARGKTIRSWVLHERLNGGKERLPDRRRRFTFVHRVGLNASLSRRLRQGAMVRVIGSGELDVNQDGKPEMNSRDASTSKPLAGPRPQPVCSRVPHLRVKRGGRISVPLPVCDSARNWTAGRWASHGNVLVRGERFIYNARKGFRGTDLIQLESKGLIQFARVTVGATSELKVRAIGDSVTAGFGYYGEGGSMNFAEFVAFCIPAKKEMNDACSSNSMSARSEEKPVEYTEDWGLAENISWAAQWANAFNVTDYENLAISGSEPGDWAPNGQFYGTTKEMEGEEPDYVLLTLGANPLLSKLLTSPGDIWCAASSDPPKYEKFMKCIEHEFGTVELRTNLQKIYKELIKNTKATIFVMQYHLSIPALAPESSREIALASKMLNQVIKSVVAEAKNSRLRLVTPPYFSVGIDMRPVYPPGGGCAFNADGPSAQSWWTQKELKLYYESEFCTPPSGGDPYWVISGDSGIHPSIAGYKQMALQVPAP